MGGGAHWKPSEGTALPGSEGDYEIDDSGLLHMHSRDPGSGISIKLEPIPVSQRTQGGKLPPITLFVGSENHSTGLQVEGDKITLEEMKFIWDVCKEQDETILQSDRTTHTDYSRADERPSLASSRSAGRWWMTYVDKLNLSLADCERAKRLIIKIEDGPQNFTIYIGNKTKDNASQFSTNAGDDVRAIFAGNEASGQAQQRNGRVSQKEADAMFSRNRRS